MRDIRTRPASNDIKVLDKSKSIEDSMKNAFIRTKEQAEKAQQTEAASPTGYAVDNVSGRVQDAAHDIGKGAEQLVRKTGKELGRLAGKAADEIRYRRAQGSEYEGAKTNWSSSGSTQPGTDSTARSAPGGKPFDYTARSRTQAASRSMKRGSESTIRLGTRAPAKTAGQSIKTAEITAKSAQTSLETAQAARTAQRAAKTAQATAKNAQRTARVAKATAKAAAATVKTIAKAVAAAAKAIAAGVKGLVAAIAAGGWVAVLVVVIVGVVALIAGSCFGIFFSGEDSGTGQTMSDVVREINGDYQDKLEEMKEAYTYDVLEMSGSRAVWKEVLAIYAVKTTTDSYDPQEVATVTDEKKELLRAIFWEMNEIFAETETKTETIIVEIDNGNGKIIQKEVTVTRTYLYITVGHKTADDMADEYGFDGEQRTQLAELLDDENDSLWSVVLYGITESDDQIVAVALSQVGNVGGEPYWSWYGFSSRVEWCACFVSWCANECGYIDSGVIPKFAGVSTGVNWFKDRGEWQNGSFVPAAGDIIFFDWEGDGSPDHVGIVEKCEDGIVYTVEGNSGNSCVDKTYAVGSILIYGYGAPAY